MYNRFLSTAGYVRRGRGNVGARCCVSRSVVFINAISFSISCRRRREPTCPCLQPGVVTSLGQHRNRAGTKSAVHDWLVLVSWRRGVVVLCLPWATRSNSRRFRQKNQPFTSVTAAPFFPVVMRGLQFEPILRRWMFYRRIYRLGM